MLATAYVRRTTPTNPGATSVLIAIASWSTQHETITLQIDYARLGISKPSSKLVAPLIPAFNRANKSLTIDPDVPLLVPALQGWLLLLQ